MSEKQKKSTVLFDVSEARKTFNSFIDEEMGTTVLVDNVETRALITDLEKMYNNIQQSSKNIQFKYGTEVERGSLIKFLDKDFLSGDEYGAKSAIVYTIPEKNAVYSICDMVICNSKPVVYELIEGFDDDPKSPTFGDRKVGDMIEQGQPVGFMELAKVVRKEKEYGIDEETILVFTTSSKYYSFDKFDIFKYKNKFYEVIIIDDITDGLVTIQLRRARLDYEQFINHI